MSRIKVVTFMGGHLSYFPYVEKIHRGYCRRHGYEYVIGRALRPDRHVAWCKVLAAEEQLATTDYLLFLDADAYFYDWSHTIEVVTSLLDHQYLMLFSTNIIDKDHKWDTEKDDTKNPNSGVYLVKNHPVARQILAEWSQIPVALPRYANAWPVDQKGLEEVILPKYGDRIRILVADYYKLNGRDGVFIRHLSGMSDDARATILADEWRRLESETEEDRPG